MPKAEHAPTTPAAPPAVTPVTRRRRLALAILAGVAPGEAASTASPELHPDAEVLRLCNEFVAITMAIHARYEGPHAIEDDDERDDILAPTRERERAVIDRLVALPAVTPEGLRAKAASYLLWDPDMERTARDEGYHDCLLRFAIVRDAAALGTGTAS